MKSLQCVELGPPDKLQIKEVSDPQIISDHVIIENKAASVNFPDVLMIQGLYQFQPELPFSPGGECSGTIVSIGENVEDLKVGDRVFAMTGLGAFSEKILAPKNSVVKIPDSMSFEPVSKPNKNPLQAALKSNAQAFTALILFCTIAAVDGVG